MLPTRCIFCLLWCIATVKGAIFSFNNKYSNKQTLTSIKIDNGDSRFRRNASPTNASVGTTTPSTSKSSLDIDKSEVAVSSFVLNGTHKSNQAYIHWIGKGTSEVFSIIMIPDKCTCRA